MSAGTTIIIVIAASGVLMMRFRKRWLAKIKIAFTNGITSLFAGWLPGFGIRKVGIPLSALTPAPVRMKTRLLGEIASTGQIVIRPRRPARKSATFGVLE
jgi:hypothetical protein